MTVKELIELLQKEDPNKPIVQTQAGNEVNMEVHVVPWCVWKEGDRWVNMSLEANQYMEVINLIII